MYLFRQHQSSLMRFLLAIGGAGIVSVLLFLGLASLVRQPDNLTRLKVTPKALTLYVIKVRVNSKLDRG